MVVYQIWRYLGKKVIIKTWGKFKKELMARFYLESEYKTQDKMSTLKHIRSIHEYIWEYSTYMLKINSIR